MYTSVIISFGLLDLAAGSYARKGLHPLKRFFSLIHSLMAFWMAFIVFPLEITQGRTKPASYYFVICYQIWTY
jgi:hypothetical protein